jgi:CRP/FNR family transcriptional regulator, polysaccharide utilization system transcription regulator
MDHQFTQQAHITHLVESLEERRKELNCIYQVNDLLRDYTIGISEAFRRIIQIIPPAWRYSEICRVCILFDDEEYLDVPFQKTRIKQTAPIVVDQKKVGEIQVYYISPVTNDKGIFLPEEQKLLTTIAEKLSSFILLKRLKEAYTHQQNQSAEVSTGPRHSVDDWLLQKGLSADEVIRFTRVKIDFRRGETICKQGAMNAYVMLIAEGLAKAYLEGFQEKGLNFKIIHPFDFVGLTSLKDTDSYRFSVSAITPCTVYLIDRDEFLQIAAGNTHLNNFLITFFCRFAGHLYNRLHCVANKQAPGRVADVLLYLSEEVFHGRQISPVISRKDIAELAGMSTESAVRILSELKSDGIIRTGKDGIEILKADLVKTISIAG